MENPNSDLTSSSMSFRDELLRRADQPQWTSPEYRQAIKDAELQVEAAKREGSSKARLTGSIPWDLVAKTAAAALVIGLTLWFGAILLKAASKRGQDYRNHLQVEVGKQ